MVWRGAAVSGPHPADAIGAGGGAGAGDGSGYGLTHSPASGRRWVGPDSATIGGDLRRLRKAPPMAPPSSRAMLSTIKTMKAKAPIAACEEPSGEATQRAGQETHPEAGGDDQPRQHGEGEQGVEESLTRAHEVAPDQPGGDTDQSRHRYPGEDDGQEQHHHHGDERDHDRNSPCKADTTGLEGRGHAGPCARWGTERGVHSRPADPYRVRRTTAGA